MNTENKLPPLKVGDEMYYRSGGDWRTFWVIKLTRVSDKSVSFTQARDGKTHVAKPDREYFGTRTEFWKVVGSWERGRLYRITPEICAEIAEDGEGRRRKDLAYRFRCLVEKCRDTDALFDLFGEELMRTVTDKLEPKGEPAP